MLVGTMVSQSVIILYYIIIGYYLILFKPVRFLYVMAGIKMTLTLIAGYVLCFINITYMANSNCMHTKYGKISTANTTIFLVVASVTAGLTHILTFI
jgi:hypothetical protein